MADDQSVADDFARLEAILDAGAGGWADQMTAREVAEILDRLEDALQDPYERGKIKSAKVWADRLFSARKHEQWGRDGGATVRQHLRADIANAARTTRYKRGEA